MKDYTWFVDGRKDPRKWTSEKIIFEARKFKRKLDFMRKLPGAYHAAAKRGLLPTFNWFEDCAINLENGRIYCIYRYVFEQEAVKYVYIGLTMRPTIRDRRHRIGDSSVFDFSQENGIPIPKMEILEGNLTQIEARTREDELLSEHKANGFVLLNRAKTGRMIGSVGGMHVKWGKAACKREALKYKSRGDFQNGAPSAYQAALLKHWLDEYTWFDIVHHNTWTHDDFLAEARKYKSIKEFYQGNQGAAQAGRLRGWMKECTWFVPGQGWKKRVNRTRKDSRVVCQYDMDGKFIAQFPTLAEAIRCTGIMSIRKCLIKERKQAGGFKWAYIGDDVE
ncbi:MAG: hypothetical protein IJS08_07245 [Victivallales bacterium]|nr:hypothetical protein [Victivallales bacterium]